MKRNILLFSLAMIFLASYAQEEGTEKKKDRPVSEPFAGGMLLDNQTTFVNEVKSLEFLIQHKFGTVENGSKDVWGIYAPGANIRLGLSYVPYKNLQLGYGLTMTDLTHDFNAKYTILEQTRKNDIPIALAVYGNVGISAFPNTEFNDEFDFKHRLSSFYQIIIGRKFTDRISLQAAVSHSHFNMADTDSSGYDFDRIGAHLNGRIKFTETAAIVFNYDQPLKLDALILSTHKDINVLPNMALGVEIATITHVFHIYASYSKEILPQYYMIRTSGEFDIEQFRIGFIIKGLKSF